MESLKKRFALRPNENETIDTYLNLIYGEGDEENDDDESTDDDIPAAGNRQQWQYAHNQRMSTCSRGRGCSQNTSQNMSRTHPSRRSENIAAEDTIWSICHRRTLLV